MATNKALTYLCPHCGSENKFHASHEDALMERLVCCKDCNKTINVTAAHSLDGQMNVVAFEHEDSDTIR